MRFYKIILFLSFVAFANSSQADFADSCPRMSKANSCSFYDKCLEAKNQCGSEGYPLNYGLKFCNIFNSMKLSSKGEKWITATMACLQEELVDFAEAKTACSTIQKKAFESHVQCYVNSGFCELPTDDKLKIAATNLWETVTSLEGSLQAAKTLAECATKD